VNQAPAARSTPTASDAPASDAPRDEAQRNGIKAEASTGGPSKLEEATAEKRRRLEEPSGGSESSVDRFEIPEFGGRK
jgi:hypothetical protein